MNVQIVCISAEIYHSAFGQIIAVNNYESAAAYASKFFGQAGGDMGGDCSALTGFEFCQLLTP